jgi:hypothetical protein
VLGDLLAHQLGTVDVVQESAHSLPQATSVLLDPASAVSYAGCVP